MLSGAHWKARRLPTRSELALFVVLAGLCVALFKLTFALAPLYNHNQYSFESFTQGIDEYRSFKPAWRPRVFSTFFAAQFTGFGQWWSSESFYHPTATFEYTVAAWSAFWFWIMGVLYITLERRRAVFFLFGTTAAILFAYVPGLLRIYPWDMPILCIYTAGLLLFLRRQYRWLFALIALGVGFKESAMVLCLAFLFTEEPRKRRISLFALSLAACCTVKLALDLYVHMPIPFFSMETSTANGEAGTSLFVQNLHALKNLRLEPLLVNSGTLLALFLLPARNRGMMGIKVMSAVVIGANLFFGIIAEYRIFFELIPFALYFLADHLLPDPENGAVRAAPGAGFSVPIKDS